MLHYITTLNLVKLAIKHKQNFIKIIHNKKTTRILYIMLKLNLIKGWFIYDKYFIKVVVNTTHTKTLYLVSKPSKYYFLKLKDLKKLQSKLNSFTVYLNTSKGIVDSSVASAQNSGGILLFLLK